MSSNTSTVYVSEDLIKVILLFCAKVVFKLNKIDIIGSIVFMSINQLLPFHQYRDYADTSLVTRASKTENKLIMTQTLTRPRFVGQYMVLKFLIFLHIR